MSSYNPALFAAWFDPYSIGLGVSAVTGLDLASTAGVINTTPVSRRIFTFDDLPSEVIKLITQHLQDQPSSAPTGGRCARRKDSRSSDEEDMYSDYYDSDRDSDDTESSRDDMDSLADMLYSDATLTFSCVSKRYRRLLFDDVLDRSVVVPYCLPCFERSLHVPERILATVRTLRIRMDFEEHQMPCDGHGCDCIEDRCCQCNGLESKHPIEGPTLDDLVGLYPNITSLDIHCEWLPPSIYDLEDHHKSSQIVQCKHLKTLSINLRTGDHAYELPNLVPYAATILETVETPALEEITIRLEEMDAQAFVEEVGELEEALCQIQSSRLVRIKLRMEALSVSERVKDCLWTPMESLIATVYKETHAKRFSVFINYNFNHMYGKPDQSAFLGRDGCSLLTESLLPSEDRLAESLATFRKAKRGKSNFSVKLSFSARHDKINQRLLQWVCKPASRDPSDSRETRVEGESEVSYTRRR